jgi:transcriptional regulator with XRE-family HTH domain
MNLWGGTADERRLYAQKSLIFDAAELVAEAMEERGWTRRQLADALKVRASEITQRLRGKRNLTLRSLADMLHVMGYEVRLDKVDRGTSATWSGPTVTTGANVTVLEPPPIRRPPWWITIEPTPGAGPTGGVGLRAEVTAGSSLASVRRP